MGCRNEVSKGSGQCWSGGTCKGGEDGEFWAKVAGKDGVQASKIVVEGT